jgi:hypothetical protein
MKKIFAFILLLIATVSFSDELSGSWELESIVQFQKGENSLEPGSQSDKFLVKKIEFSTDDTAYHKTEGKRKTYLYHYHQSAWYNTDDTHIVFSPQAGPTVYLALEPISENTYHYALTKSFIVDFGIMKKAK